MSSSNKTGVFVDVDGSVIPAASTFEERIHMRSIQSCLGQDDSPYVGRVVARMLNRAVRFDKKLSTKNMPGARARGNPEALERSFDLVSSSVWAREQRSVPCVEVEPRSKTATLAEAACPRARTGPLDTIGVCCLVGNG